MLLGCSCDVLSPEGLQLVAARCMRRAPSLSSPGLANWLHNTGAAVDPVNSHEDRSDRYTAESEGRQGR